MSGFINGSGIISTQKTFDKSVFHSGMTALSGNRWAANEPDYSAYIDGKQIRRMSRIIRMGIYSSILAAKEAGVEKPDAIIVGTAFGCLEDTYSFLSKLVQYREDMLSPTAFIHSTHNTIAAQIALLFQSHGYNSTYVHRALSFENALADALLLTSEKTAGNILVGGIDEITDASFNIKQRFGFYKKEEVNSDNYYSFASRGSAAGEGSAFFCLSPEQTEVSYAKISAVETFSFTELSLVVQATKNLSGTAGIGLPDLVITGHNGDRENDAANNSFVKALGCADRVLRYKHWCGEYATATGFATWLGGEILRNKSIPGFLQGPLQTGSPVKSILIYNQQEARHHSLILLQSC